MMGTGTLFRMLVPVLPAEKYILTCEIALMSYHDTLEMISLFRGVFPLEVDQIVCFNNVEQHILSRWLEKIKALCFFALFSCEIDNAHTDSAQITLRLISSF